MVTQDEASIKPSVSSYESYEEREEEQYDGRLSRMVLKEVNTF